MTQAAKRGPARSLRTSADWTIGSGARKKPSVSGTKAEVARVILDPALPPRHLTKSAIKAAVKHVLKETTKVAS